jgi:hypothetical protein
MPRQATDAERACQKLGTIVHRAFILALSDRNGCPVTDRLRTMLFSGAYGDKAKPSRIAPGGFAV